MRHALKLITKEPDDLQTQAAVAQSEQDALAKAAREAEHDAQLAAIASENNRIEKEDDRLEKKARWALKEARFKRRVADEHAVAVGGLLRRARLERETAELAALRPLLGANGPAMKQRDHLGDIIAEFRRSYRGALVDLRDAVAAQNRLLSKAEALARSLGIEERFGSVNLQEVLEGVVAPLMSKNWQQDQTGYVSLSTYVQDGSSTGERFKFEMSGPIFGGNK